MYFGKAVEADMDAAVARRGKGKKQMSDTERDRRRQAVLDQYLGIEQEKKFRDPVRPT